jgi:hypothetical protein
LPADASRADSKRPLVSDARSLAGSFTSGLVGYALTLLVVASASGTFLGVVAAAGIYALSGLILDVGIRSSPRSGPTDRVGVKALWFIAATLWLFVSVPIAAFLSPQYSLRGLSANGAAIVIVFLSDAVIARASRRLYRGR